MADLLCWVGLGDLVGRTGMGIGEERLPMACDFYGFAIAGPGWNGDRNHG